MNPSYPISSWQSAPPPSSPECALEILSPRIAEKICMLWGTADLEAFIAELMLDSRDGARQGFPLDVAEELLLLMDLSVANRAIIAAQATGEPYRKVFQAMRNNADRAAQERLDPPSRPMAASTPATTTPSRSSRPASKPRARSWWQRFFG